MTPVRYALAALLVILPLGLSLAIPEYLGRGATWFELPSALTETELIAAIQDGYWKEREGDLYAALAKYHVAQAARHPEIREAAMLAISRVNEKLKHLGPGYDSLRTLADWSITLRLPLLLGGAVILLFVATSATTRRSGTEIRRFVTIPGGEEGYSVPFDRLLNEEMARIARVFRSDHLGRIGAAVMMSYPEADRELSGLEARAIAAVQQAELKSILGFWLAEMVRWFQNIGVRPEYVISGTVVISPDGAVAYAQFTHTGRSGRVIALDASSAEAAPLQFSERRPLSPVTPSASAIGPDQRQDARNLADLARVLACKLFVCWMEMELTKAASNPRHIVAPPHEVWPATWQTVHDYVGALTTLESGR